MNKTIMDNREFDLIIAKEIFGWDTYEDIPPDVNGENAGKVLVPYKGYLKELFDAGYTLPHKGKVVEGSFTPQYSSSFENAFEVVRKVKLPTPAWELPANPRNLVAVAYDYFKLKQTNNGK